MSQDIMELRGSRVIELRRLDRILTDLSRPTLEEVSMAPSTRAALMQVGVVVSGEASRRHLIERLLRGTCSAKGARPSTVGPGSRSHELPVTRRTTQSGCVL
jgi:hypothetical protein